MNLYISSPQSIWHQGPISWKTVFPWTWAGGWCPDDSSTLPLLCTLFLLLLHQLHLRSSGLRSRRWGPLLYTKKNREMSLKGYLPKALGLPRPTGLSSQKADAHDFGGISQSLLPGDALTEMEFQGSTWGWLWTQESAGASGRKCLLQVVSSARLTACAGEMLRPLLPLLQLVGKLPLGKFS